MLPQLLPTPSAGWRVAMGLSCPSFSASSGLAASGFPSGASCHLASGDWSTVLTTCHRQVNLKLLLKRKIRGRCQPASSCYKAGVALSKPPPSPLFPIFVYLLCGQGKVAVEPLQEWLQGRGWSFSLAADTTEELEGVFQG